MRGAFAALWGRQDGFAGIELSGRTDRALLKEAMLACGLPVHAFTEALRRFKRAYFRRLTRTLPLSEGHVLPGVTDLLQRLAGDDSATVGLGTGNFRVSAAMKLRYYDIDGYFALGGFGDQVEDRAQMIAQAIAVARRRAGRHAKVFVIGDTINDITSAKLNAAIAVGVATGPASEDVLTRAGADIVLPTLEQANDI